MKPRMRSGIFSVPAAVLERTGSLRKRRPCAVSSFGIFTMRYNILSKKQ